MSRRLALTAAAAALLLGAGGCVLGPEPAAPALDAPGSYQSQPIGDLAGARDAPWWEGFDDEAFGATVDAVLSGNPGVAASFARLAQAGALEDAARSDLFPTVDGIVDASYSRDLSDDGARALDFAAGGALAYTADLFGRNRRRVTQAIALFEAADYDVDDARRLAARAAGLQFIEYRRSGARLALLETSLELQRRTLEIVRSRFDAGISPALDVDRAAADLERTRSDKGVLVANRKVAAYALAVLAGRPPGDGLVTAAGEDDEEEDVPTFIGGRDIAPPAALLRNRPDVRRAEAVLVAELAAVGVEQADLYPSLRLPGSVTAGSADLLSAGIDRASASISALIDVPLFDFGRRRAEVRAQQARADAARIAYRAVLLDALADVENALVLIEASQARLESLNNAVEASENAYRQLNALYREGLASFIDVLDSQRTLISSREAVIETRADLASEIVRLYAAIGDAPDRE